MLNKLIIIILIFISTIANAQTDSLLFKHHEKYALIKKLVLPVTFIIAGSLLSNSTFEQNLKIKIRNTVGNDFKFGVDDYLQYAPIAEMYIADMLKIKSKNHWFNQTKYLLISNLITASITHAIKRTSLKLRPNGSPHAFPSGHTSFSFTNATVLYNEFSDTSPYLAYSGYVFSTTTGAFRMINNKHWVSDVLVGAGIGILVTNLVYHFEPLKNWNPFIGSENITLIPQIDNNGYGIYLSVRM